jgi:hypothetical protein
MQRRHDTAAAGGVGDGRRWQQRRQQWRQQVVVGSRQRQVAATKGGEMAVARSIHVLQTSNQLHNAFVTFVTFVTILSHLLHLLHLSHLSHLSHLLHATNATSQSTHATNATSCALPKKTFYDTTVWLSENTLGFWQDWKYGQMCFFTTSANWFFCQLICLFSRKKEKRSGTHLPDPDVVLSGSTSTEL